MLEEPGAEHVGLGEASVVFDVTGPLGARRDLKFQVKSRQHGERRAKYIQKYYLLFLSKQTMMGSFVR